MMEEEDAFNEAEDAAFHLTVHDSSDDDGLGRVRNVDNDPFLRSLNNHDLAEVIQEQINISEQLAQSEAVKALTAQQSSSVPLVDPILFASNKINPGFDEAAMGKGFYGFGSR